MPTANPNNPNLSPWRTKKRFCVAETSDIRCTFVRNAKQRNNRHIDGVTCLSFGTSERTSTRKDLFVGGDWRRASSSSTEGKIRNIAKLIIFGESAAAADFLLMKMKSKWRTKVTSNIQERWRRRSFLVGRRGWNCRCSRLLLFLRIVVLQFAKLIEEKNVDGRLFSAIKTFYFRKRFPRR